MAKAPCAPILDQQDRDDGVEHSWGEDLRFLARPVTRPSAQECDRGHPQRSALWQHRGGDLCLLWSIHAEWTLTRALTGSTLVRLE